jgi:hypothetical protein
MAPSSLEGVKGGEGRGLFGFFFVVPNVSHHLLIMFYQVLIMFPDLFPIAPHIVQYVWLNLIFLKPTYR